MNRTDAEDLVKLYKIREQLNKMLKTARRGKYITLQSPAGGSNDISFADEPAVRILTSLLAGVNLAIINLGGCDGQD